MSGWKRCKPHPHTLTKQHIHTHWNWNCWRRSSSSSSNCSSCLSSSPFAFTLHNPNTTNPSPLSCSTFSLAHLSIHPPSHPTTQLSTFGLSNSPAPGSATMALRILASQAASALRISTRPRTFPAHLTPFSRLFSSKFPPEKKYSKSHEWIHVEGGTGTMGLTTFALEQLGDVVYVELPEVGRVVNPGESFCTVESVKAASAVYAPIGGEVIEINEEMAANPEKVNKDPHGESWLVKLKVADPSHLNSLLDADSYQEVVEKEKH